MPRVLFVDDNDAVRDVMTELISAYKYDVVPTETAELAISILESDSSFDILFTDIRLGIGHSGIWLARKVQSEYPHMAIVLTTGYSSALPRWPIPWPIVQKPTTGQVIVSMFEHVLAEKHSGSPSPA